MGTWNLSELLPNLIVSANGSMEKQILVEILTNAGYDRAALDDTIQNLIQQGVLKIQEQPERAEVINAQIPKRSENELNAKALQELSFEQRFALILIWRQRKISLAEIVYYMNCLPGYQGITSAELLNCLVATGFVNTFFFQEEREWAVFERISLSLSEDVKWNQGDLAKEEKNLHKENRQALCEQIRQRFELPKENRFMKAFEAVDRIHFVPKQYQPIADMDAPVPLDAENRYTNTPSDLMKIIQTLNPQEGEKVLVCGVKGGLLTALLRKLVGKKGAVVCVESDEVVVQQARKSLNAVADTIKPVQVLLQDDVTLGSSLYRWDIVFLNGSLPKIPFEIIDQMDDTRSRILFFLREPWEKEDKGYLLRKDEETITEEKFQTWKYSPIFGKYGWDDTVSIKKQYEKLRDDSEDANIQHLQQKTPYPLAKSFFRAYNNIELHEQHKDVLDALELLIRYFTIPCVAECLRSENAEDLEFKKKLEKLERPSLGTWLKLLNHTSRLVSDSRVGSVILQDIKHVWKDGPIVDAYQHLSSCTQNEDDGSGQKVNLIKFLDRATAYRNAFTHGHLKLGQKRLKQNTKALLDAFQTIFTYSNLVTNFELTAVNDVKLDEKGEEHIATVNRLNGRGYTLTKRQPAGDVKPNTVYLCEEGTPICPLSPWVVFDEGEHDERDLFVYAQKNLMLTFYNSDRFPPEDKQELNEVNRILQWAKAAAPEGAAEAMSHSEPIYDMMEDFGEDGVISHNEMSKLVQRLRKYNLVKTEDEARNLIECEIKNRCPGVYFAEQ